MTHPRSQREEAAEPGRLTPEACALATALHPDLRNVLTAPSLLSR